MKLSSINKVCLTSKSQPQKHASIRLILLPMVTFALGVAATTSWFHLNASRNAASPGLPANTQFDAEPSDTGQRSAPAARPATSNLAAVDPAAVAAVKQAIPDFANVSLADGEQILRTAAMKEFGAATQAADDQVKAAQQQLAAAGNGQSAAEQQAAMKQLQQSQAMAADQLKEISAKLSAQIAAWESLKNGG